MCNQVEIATSKYVQKQCEQVSVFYYLSMRIFCTPFLDVVVINIIIFSSWLNFDTFVWGFFCVGLVVVSRHFHPLKSTVRLIRVCHSTIQNHKFYMGERHTLMNRTAQKRQDETGNVHLLLHFEPNLFFFVNKTYKTFTRNPQQLRQNTQKLMLISLLRAR